MLKPCFGGELLQLLCATNWMRSRITNYTDMISPLHTLMETLYSRTGKRTKKKLISKLQLSELWEGSYDTEFQSIKKFLLQSNKLAYPKRSHTVCLFSDASDTHWASMLTQVPSEDVTLLLEDQRHEI